VGASAAVVTTENQQRMQKILIEAVKMQIFCILYASSALTTGEEG
jgi:hypothetical protein